MYTVISTFLSRKCNTTSIGIGSGRGSAVVRLSCRHRGSAFDSRIRDACYTRYRQTYDAAGLLTGHVTTRVVVFSLLTTQVVDRKKINGSNRRITVKDEINLRHRLK